MPNSLTPELLEQSRMMKNNQRIVSDDSIFDYYSSKNPNFYEKAKKVQSSGIKFQYDDGSEIPTSTALLNYEAYGDPRGKGKPNDSKNEFNINDVIGEKNSQGYFSNIADRFKRSFGTSQDQSGKQEVRGLSQGIGAAIKDIPGDIADVAGYALPAAGSIVGSIAGGIAGIPSGPGAIFSGIAGSAGGAALGEVARQATGRLLGERKGETLKGEAFGIAKEAALGAMAEIGGRAISPLAESASRVLKESASRSIGKILNPTTLKNKAITQKITPEILKRPIGETIAMTRKGMEKKSAERAIESGLAINEGPKLAGKTSTESIINALEEEKSNFIAGGKAINQQALDNISALQDVFKQYGSHIADQTLREIKTIFDKEVYGGSKVIGKTLDESSKLSFKKVATDKIRSLLAERHPEINKLNKEFTFWKSLSDVLGATNQRKTGQSQIAGNIAGAIGASTGDDVVEASGKFLMVKLAYSALTSPAWRLASGKIKNRIANLMIDGTAHDLGKFLIDKKLISLPVFTSLQGSQIQGAEQNGQANANSNTY